ncbi:MAG: LptE family protein [Nitrospirota bacterium]
MKKTVSLFSMIPMFIALVAMLSSCGYRFTPMSSIIPEGAKTIAIPVFLNGTNEPYLDTELTRAVVEEFFTDGRLTVVSLERADLILRGTVTKFDAAPVAYTADSRVQTYNISIGVSLSLEDVKTQKILLQEKGLGSIFVQSYAVTLETISATKTAKEAAMRNASKDIASSIRSKVLEGF